MRFHEFGNQKNPIIILIHGTLTPWQIFLPIAEHFKEEYRVIIPALNAHIAEEKTEFISIEQEAKEIEDFVYANYSSKVFAVCGLSLGGAIAHTLLSNQKLRIRNIILDGAPLVKSGKLLSGIMTRQYIGIVEKSKKRDKKTLFDFSKNFLPEKYLSDYLAFVDNTSINSIRNMIFSVGESKLSPTLDLTDTKMLYLHGTSINEMLSKKSAKLIAKQYPEACVVCFKGDSHCYCAIYEPDDWAQLVKDFLHRAN